MTPADLSENTLSDNTSCCPVAPRKPCDRQRTGIPESGNDRIAHFRVPLLNRLVATPALTFLLFVAQYAVGSADEKGVERTVTKQDMPRIPHTEPADAVASFRLAKGMQLELVAAEPLVGDPVDACFDEFGRMFVAEMHGYPFSQEPTKLNPAGGGMKNAGIIRMLEDTNGDGRMDRSVVFADQISWPTSVCCYNGGIFVIAPQYLYYFKDTDQDGKADVREVVLSGFGRDNVQAVTNGLKWELDNRICFAAGRNPKDLTHRDNKMEPVGSTDLRFNPRTEEFEAVTGGLQFGHSMDDWGTRFVCSNSNHIQQVIFPQRYLERNPYLIASGLIRSIAADGASARVFRISPPEPWRIVRQKWRAAEKGYRLVVNDDGGWEFIPLDPSKKAGAVPTEYPVGFFTSATGITIYRGDAYPAEFQGNAFVGDVGGNLVHRKLLDTTGVVYTAVRADEGEELLASKDNWFRPVNFVNAPDGSLFVLDMYRETIEHPYSIPEEIKAFLHLTSGHDRGRIYRLTSPGMQRRPVVKPGTLSNAALVQQLESGNAWHRETAQRLLWERQDATVVPLVERFLATTHSPLGRLHALYLLDGLDALKPSHLRHGLADKHPRLRAHAVRLSERFLGDSADLLSDLIPLCGDNSEHVRFQLAFSLGESSHELAVEGLARLARDPRNGEVVQTALLSSVGNTADQLMTDLLSDAESLQQRHVQSIVAKLGQIIGSNPDGGQAIRLLSTVIDSDSSLQTQQMLLNTLGEGLSRRGVTISELIETSEASTDLQPAVANLFENCVRIASDESTSVASRQAAITILSWADWESAAAHLPDFLSSRNPRTLQRAAVAALAQQKSNDVSQVLLENWSTFSPVIRGDVVDALLASVARTHKLLDAVDTGTVKRGDIDRTAKQLLLNHRVADIRTRSTGLFGSEVSTNRSGVVAEYQGVLNLDADVSRGQAVFKKTCASCHRVGDIGHQVAPDLASVKNKSEADLLIAILDPNREAQPNFNVYTVVTEQGRSFNGIIASETANSVTLKRAEAKEDVILRSNIEEMISTGSSLMPEGLEKDLSAQDFADVIAFVKSIGGASASK